MDIGIDKPYRIFSDNIEADAVEQFKSAMLQPFTIKGALMPDAHYGYSLPIGAVVATDNVIVPAWVGYDIGCGMCAVQTGYPAAVVRARAEDISDGIYRSVPVGFACNEKVVQLEGLSDVPHTSFVRRLLQKGMTRHIGSLGGGNHFIEVGEDSAGFVWVVVHSGSRHFGHAVATYYMKLASNSDKAKEGHHGFDTSSKNGLDYITDMNFALEFALANREEIVERVLDVIAHAVGGTAERLAFINRNHNHAEQKDEMWIHRKGATHAESGMMGVVPGNMRDGSFIVMGKGHPDALYSSSHGAGRVMGRKVAKETLSMDDFVAQMTGICAVVDPSTLDESPSAYKNIFTVMQEQSELVEVLTHIKPIINVKG